MITPKTETKILEVQALFLQSGLKDLKPFGETNKAKTAFRKEMQELSYKDVNGLFGLAFLADYENNWDIALANFKKAYINTHKEVIASINYASYLARLNNYDEALSIYNEIFNKYPSDENLLASILEALSENLIPEKISDFVNRYTGPNKQFFENKVHTLIKLKTVLKDLEVDIEFYRLVRNLSKQVYFKYFTTGSLRVLHDVIDKDHNFILLENRIDYSSFDYALSNLSPAQKYDEIFKVIGKLNDEFQNDLLDYMYSEKCTLTRSEFRKQTALLNFLYIPELPEKLELYQDAS